MCRCPGFRSGLAMVCALTLIPGDLPVHAWQQSSTQHSSAPPSKTPPEHLDSLVAPVALYAGPLLAQVLAASTYPLEIVRLRQWLAKNKNLKDKELADAAAKQSWDPSVQAMAALPDVVKRLGD